MTEQGPQSGEHPQCAYFHFGLIVTGETEEQHLPKLFKALMATGICHFEVIQKTDQLDPRTSSRPRRDLVVVGTNQKIPRKDWEEIGRPARDYVNQSGCHFVILIDDLEYRRRNDVQQVFDRYQEALNILPDTLKHRASVHFLVYMLEAYYFADAQAINAVLGTALSACGNDVETIRNPKSKLRHMHHSFDVIDDGGKILDRIDIEHVLSRSDACASLRTLFAWCVKVLAKYPNYDCTDLDDKYRLHDGLLSVVTGTQLDNF